METLVLNHAFEPHQRISWSDAVTLLVRGVAEVIESYADRLIRSENWTLNMPSIIRLLTKVKRKRGIRFSRQNVFLRDKGKCQYCGNKLEFKDATFDHVTPKSQGGTTKWENIVIACVPCNQRKGNQSLMDSGMRLIMTPVKPKSLPEAPGLKLKGAPSSWMPYIRSYVYKHAELEE